MVRCPVVILNRPLRIALLSYRSKPHCGGQGIYVRHLTRELHALGHHVEVFSGQPYPELDEGPVLHEVPSLDLYRDDDPFRTPHWREYRDWIDVLETATMWTGRLPRAADVQHPGPAGAGRGAADFDVVHDNQVLGYGMLGVPRLGLPLVTSVHHPISVDRRIELAAARRLARLSKRRWYGFVRMQARVARRVSDTRRCSPCPSRPGATSAATSGSGPSTCGSSRWAWTPGCSARARRPGCRAGSSRWPAPTPR